MAFSAAAIAEALKAKMDEPIDPRGPLVPAGQYIGKILPIKLPETNEDTKSDFRAITYAEKDFDTKEETGNMIDACIWTVWFEVRGPEIKEVFKKDTARVPYDMFLDIADSGAADFSDRKVGTLMEVCGINSKGAQILQLQGKQCTVTVEHIPRKDKPEIVNAKVTRVSKLER